MQILTNVVTRLTKSTVTTFGNHPILVLGETTCVLQYKSKKLEAKFLVVDADTNHLPLLYISLCEHLGMLKELTNSPVSNVW